MVTSCPSPSIQLFAAVGDETFDLDEIPPPLVGARLSQMIVKSGSGSSHAAAASINLEGEP